MACKCSHPCGLHGLHSLERSCSRSMQPLLPSLLLSIWQSSVRCDRSEEIRFDVYLLLGPMASGMSQVHTFVSACHVLHGHKRMQLHLEEFAADVLAPTVSQDGYQARANRNALSLLRSGDPGPWPAPGGDWSRSFIRKSSEKYRRQHCTSNDASGMLVVSSSDP